MLQLYQIAKSVYMKQILESLIKARDEHQESFRLSSVLFMIALFLIFWSASFYILISGLD
jgi:hypothetical protein